MFKKVLMGVVVCSFFLLLSCVSNSAEESRVMVFDSTLPKNETVLAWFTNGIEVSSFNGTPVERGRNWSCIQIPAGEATVGTTVAWSDAVSRYTGTDLYFRYVFEKGKEHCIVFTPYGGRGDVWGVNIYEGKEQKEEKLIAFVPFEKKSI